MDGNPGLVTDNRLLSTDGATSPGALPLPDVRVWAVAHTKARSEKVVAEFLRSRGVGHYLPLVLNRRRYGARRRESWLPLFPGYLFYDRVAIDESCVQPVDDA